MTAWLVKSWLIGFNLTVEISMTRAWVLQLFSLRPTIRHSYSAKPKLSKRLNKSRRRKLNSCTISSWLTSVIIHGTCVPRFIQLNTRRQRRLRDKMPRRLTSSLRAGSTLSLAILITLTKKLVKKILTTWQDWAWIDRSTLSSCVKMETGAQLSSSSSVWRSLLDSLLLTRPPPSTSFSYMDWLQLSVSPSSSVPGPATLMKLPTQSQWWSLLNAATWCGTRRTWLRRRSVIVCYRR